MIAQRRIALQSATADDHRQLRSVRARQEELLLARLIKMVQRVIHHRAALPGWINLSQESPDQRLRRPLHHFTQSIIGVRDSAAALKQQGSALQGVQQRGQPAQIA